eukprot:CAMPEP_0185003314 /NCGR_PEP_ID=MMETSP1098-20130426/76210_1 /TAXON_ID=89044 /ORGANISM="Spumella elongata, Strain CCAP 955/1" /LENGTH=143 /DNA_ID=CAMNT_0027530959 /DNA_START=30 /DNA_END=457 /DNA_ORIENTATION=-
MSSTAINTTPVVQHSQGTAVDVDITGPHVTDAACDAAVTSSCDAAVEAFHRECADAGTNYEVNVFHTTMDTEEDVFVIKHTKDIATDVPDPHDPYWSPRSATPARRRSVKDKVLEVESILQRQRLSSHDSIGGSGYKSVPLSP